MLAPDPIPRPMLPSPSVSIDQAAALLHVSRRTIYNRIRAGLLHTKRTPSGSQRVLRESLGSKVA